MSRIRSADKRIRNRDKATKALQKEAATEAAALAAEKPKPAVKPVRTTKAPKPAPEPIEDMPEPGTGGEVGQ